MIAHHYTMNRPCQCSRMHTADAGSLWCLIYGRLDMQRDVSARTRLLAGAWAAGPLRTVVPLSGVGKSAPVLASYTTDAWRL